MKNKVFYSILILFVAIISGLIGETIGENRSKETTTIAGFEEIEFAPLNNILSESDIQLALGETYLSASKASTINELILKRSEEKNLQTLIAYLNKAKKKTKSSFLIEIEKELSKHQEQLKNLQSDIEDLNLFLEALSSTDNLVEKLKNNKNNSL